MEQHPVAKYERYRVHVGRQGSHHFIIRNSRCCLGAHESAGWLVGLLLTSRYKMRFPPVWCVDVVGREEELAAYRQRQTEVRSTIELGEASRRYRSHT